MGNLKERMPYYECPGFNTCSCNDCPLDPLSLVAGGSLHFGLKGEAKCRAEKPTRQRIASKYPDLLRFVGLSKRHFQAQQAWNALSPEKRDLKLQALANARKSLYPRVMGVDDRQVLNTKEPKQAILKDIEAPRRRVPLQGPVAALLITGLLLGVSVCFASICHAYTDEQIVNAIYKAEGGKKAQYAYGIRSVSYKDEAEARKICFNTVRNNRTRFTNQSKYTDYLEFLASRYCPVGCDNDRGTNKYWLKNVRYFLTKEGKDG